MISMLSLLLAFFKEVYFCALVHKKKKKKIEQLLNFL